MNIPERLKSRKFWLTVITFVVNLYAMHATPEGAEEARIVLIGLMDAVIAVYLLAQGMVDKEIEKSKGVYPGGYEEQ